jgi:DNA-binding response OmpR family regulator
MQTMQRTDDRIHSVSVPSTALVIEDNAELRRLICEEFEFAGFDAYEAKNGVDGLKSTACYSLPASPSMSISRTCPVSRSLTVCDPHRKVPVIILSGRSNVADRVTV